MFFFLLLLLILYILTSSVQIISFLLFVFPHFPSFVPVTKPVLSSGALEISKLHSALNVLQRVFPCRNIRIRLIWP